MMFPIMVKTSNELIGAIENERETNGTVEAKDLSARYTIDIIGSCVFGIECNGLKEPNAEFKIRGRRFAKLSKLQQLILFFAVTFPNIAKFLKLRLLPKAATDFFWNAVKETANYREQNNVRRDDLMQLLLDMKQKDGVENENSLTFAEIAAQCFLFFVAGFETSATILSFALVELALNEDVQNKLRDEVMQHLKENDGEITYEAIMNMKYMDLVVNETLRKYPPVPALPRECTEDYRIPGTQTVIKKGEYMFIPILGIHYDPEYYPNPEKFDPNRFNEENTSKRHQFAFIPYGEGPRICIAYRFGAVQIKLALTAILRNYRFQINSQTKLPIKFDPGNVVTEAEGGLCLDFEKI